MSIRKDMLADSIDSALGISTNVPENTTIAKFYNSQNDQFSTVVVPVSLDLAEEYIKEHYLNAKEPTGVFEGTSKSSETTLTEIKSLCKVIDDLMGYIIETEELHEEIALSRLDPCSQ